jgi:hypothetical protein
VRGRLCGGARCATPMPLRQVSPSAQVTRSRPIYSRVEFSRNGWTAPAREGSSHDWPTHVGRTQTPRLGEGRGFESRLPL